MEEGGYTMKNKNTNTNYQKVVRVEDQKWEIVENSIRIIFFVWDWYSLILYREFLIPRKKIHPYLKYQFSLKILIGPISFLYKPSEKRLDYHPSNINQGWGERRLRVEDAMKL